MRLFGFGAKKKEQEPQTTSKKVVQLNRRKEDRYLVKDLSTNYGDVIDIAKSGISLKAINGSLNIGDFVDLRLQDLQVEASVSVVQRVRTALQLQQPISQKLIKKHLLLPQDFHIQTKGSIDIDNLFQDKDIEVNRAIINLMLEIDDPNATIEKFQESIEKLPKLKEMLLKRANSIEKARAARVEDVKSAITRLGFEEVREIVYEYINYDINLNNDSLTDFKNFDLYTILLNHIFKRFAALLHFNDLKSEGRSLLSMSYIGAVLMSKEKPELNSYYTSAKELFGFEMRLKEKIALDIDLLDVCRLYFLETLGVFRYIYDGFVLAHLLLTPSLEINFPITLSERKLKFAYVAYLTILAQKFILAKDPISGYILFNRLRRYGLNLQEAKEFINTTIENVNSQLAKIGTNKRVPLVEYPSYSFSLSALLGKNVYTEYFINKMTAINKEGERVAIRYEDNYYAHKILEAVVQNDNFSFKTMPYCIIPCEALADEDLSLDQFSSFDLVIFRNIDKLPSTLFSDFKKIWNDFEGKIVVTYAKESMIDFNNEELYRLLQEVVVDIPSYFQSPSMYLKMVQNTLSEIKRFSNKEVCDLEDFKEGVLTQKGVYLRCLG